MTRLTFPPLKFESTAATAETTTATAKTTASADNYEEGTTRSERRKNLQNIPTVRDMSTILGVS